MAQSRYRMQSVLVGVGVEASFNEEGRNALVELRKKDARFKHQRIYGMIQALPESLPIKGKTTEVFKLA